MVKRFVKTLILLSAVLMVGIHFGSAAAAASVTGSTASGNVPTMASCTDSDKGLAYDVKGYIEGKTPTGKSVKMVDSCADSVYLNEYICTEKHGTKKVFNCRQFPGGDRRCIDGVCAVPTASVQKKPKTGIGAPVTGNVKADDKKNPVATLMTERYSACEDSDNGKTFDAAGKVTAKTVGGKERVFEDACTSVRVLREFFCTGKNPRSANYNCLSLGKGYSCSAGACVKTGAKPNTAAVSDGGKPTLPVQQYNGDGSSGGQDQ